MRAGYGRGYYGEGQLAPRQRSGSGLIKIALVVGVGTAVWYFWPRKPEYEYVPVDDAPPQPQPAPELPQPQLQPVIPPFDSLALAQAQSRGYCSQQAYEDAVVTSARELQETGAKVVLAPHLQHLALRLLP